MAKKREDNAFWRALASVERFVIILTAIGTTLIVSGACILRWFNINFNGFEEILIIVAFWLYMIGCAYGTYEKSQITADIVEVMMKECFAKELIRLVRYTLTFVLGAIMMYWALHLLLWTIEMDTRTPVYRVPTAVGQSSMLLGLVLLTFYNAVYLYDNIKEFVSRHVAKTEACLADAEGGAKP
ncbi:MAG: TRAP transporter small permease subunit [Clostridiales bacterium]|nr:TRAP transporter small permease subunit [Clostridiales bacterium]